MTAIPRRPPAAGWRPARSGSTSSISTALSKGDRSIDKAVAQIRAAVDIPIQLGGGLRRLTDLEDAFGAGIDRAILGTVALRDPELVISAVARWGDRIAVALDARDGRLATDGWLGQTDAAPSTWRNVWLGVACAISSSPTSDVTARSPDQTCRVSTS